MTTTSDHPPVKSTPPRASHQLHVPLRPLRRFPRPRIWIITDSSPPPTAIIIARPSGELPLSPLLPNGFPMPPSCSSHHSTPPHSQQSPESIGHRRPVPGEPSSSVCLTVGQKAELAWPCGQAGLGAKIGSAHCDENITNMDTTTLVAYDSKVKLFFSTITFNTCDEWTLHHNMCSISFTKVLIWIKEGVDHAGK
jgi:hypothetical protein